eukprot:TRINITY_DN17440_c0_g1_i1.p1 TRINITY_DN17440_c0_g1~~TRINITY_DN17440_c0_g1_i1.p1  ORF type:complete len:264 (+),score=34.08 TRINITY_DN17440_c0_g1_i1:137-928(+)
MAALTASSVDNFSVRPSEFCVFVSSCKAQWKPRRAFFKLRVCCRLKTSHSSRNYFRKDSIEDVLTTSWAFYNFGEPLQVQQNRIGEQSSENLPGSEDSKTSDGDAENSVFLPGNVRDKKGRRTSRASNPSMSLSRSLDLQLNGGYTAEAPLRPATLSKQFPGTAGLYMALVFALLGVATAGASLLGLSSSQEECAKCAGYGVERCHLCNGSGIIEFERDFKDVIPCPLCIGSGLEKCPACDGLRRKKGVPPFLQQETLSTVTK